MRSFQVRRAASVAAIVAMVIVSYAAGRAQGADDSVTRMNLSIDFLVKARALLDATTVRAGANDVANAKKNVDKAIESTTKAIKANGG